MGWAEQFLSVITSVITEPEPAIIHFKNTRKSGFACITLLFGVLQLAISFAVQVECRLIPVVSIEPLGGQLYTCPEGMPVQTEAPGLVVAIILCLSARGL